MAVLYSKIRIGIGEGEDQYVVVMRRRTTQEYNDYMASIREKSPESDWYEFYSDLINQIFESLFVQIEDLYDEEGNPVNDIAVIPMTLRTSIINHPLMGFTAPSIKNLSGTSGLSASAKKSRK